MKAIGIIRNGFLVKGDIHNGKPDKTEIICYLLGSVKVGDKIEIQDASTDNIIWTGEVGGINKCRDILTELTITTPEEFEGSVRLTVYESLDVENILRPINKIRVI